MTMNKIIFTCLVFLLFLMACIPQNDLRIQVIYLGETIAEFAIAYPLSDGENPFDLWASATFTLKLDKKKRSTEFYYGQDRMRFRFADIETGEWTFKTQKQNAALNGFTAQVNILPAKGKKWIWNGSQKVRVPQLAMGRILEEYENESVQENDIEEFLENHSFNRFHIPSNSMGWFQLDKSNGRYTDINFGKNPNPSPEAFAVLEQLIWNTYRVGGQLHFWWWGDESRKKTTVKLGTNGEVNQRLQRYLATRLSAIPVWNYSYGFDLFEWVTPEQLQIWHKTLQQKLLLPHLISGRSKNQSMEVYSNGLSHESFEHHRRSYEMYLQIYENSQKKPVFSEDHFQIRNRSKFSPKDYPLELNFKALWHSTLVGGVGNIWGSLGLGDGIKNNEESQPYYYKSAIKTYSSFFFEKERFGLNFEPILKTQNVMWAKILSKKILIGYLEEGKLIEKSNIPEGEIKTFFAVDIFKSYQEFEIIPDTKGNLKLPYLTDWALIIQTK